MLDLDHLFVAEGYLECVQGFLAWYFTPVVGGEHLRYPGGVLCLFPLLLVLLQQSA